MTVVHALSVDVEDWFQVLNMADVVDRSDWDRLELRCGDSTRRLLDVFGRHDAKATFFFLGWIAERLPELVREVVAAGHEIGSHGYDHKTLGDLGPAGFAADLERTTRVLEETTGRRPKAFRACTWSVTRRTPWSVDALVAHGISLDSSIQPIRHPEYGVPGAPVGPYRLVAGGGELVEFPPLTLQCMGRRLPVGGGGYLRLLPLALVKAGLRRVERAGMPGCIYLHPWEVDPKQPRPGLRGLRGFRHYVNLGRTSSKLERLLGEFAFAGLEESLTRSFGQRESWRAKLPEYRASELLG